MLIINQRKAQTGFAFAGSNVFFSQASNGNAESDIGPNTWSFSITTGLTANSTTVPARGSLWVSGLSGTRYVHTYDATNQFAVSDANHGSTFDALASAWTFRYRWKGTTAGGICTRHTTFQLSIEASGVIRSRIFDTSSTSTFADSAATSALDGNWHMIHHTFNAGTCAMYIDGASAGGGGTTTATALRSDAWNLAFGHVASVKTGAVGEVADAAWFDGVMSAADVAYDYANG